MNIRRLKNDETSNRLLNWTDGQKASERLAGHILASDGYKEINPSQPLGGPDGLADLVCIKNGIKWIVAVYFANGSKPFSNIKAMFQHACHGAIVKKVDGFVFVTNQYLTVNQRSNLEKLASVPNIEIYHLERLVHILNTPINYGTRLEFLSIEMAKEEQIAFITTINGTVDRLEQSINELRTEFRAVMERFSLGNKG